MATTATARAAQSSFAQGQTLVDPSQQPRYVSSRRSSSSSATSSSGGHAKAIARPYSYIAPAQADQFADASGGREELLWSQSDLYGMTQDAGAVAGPSNAGASANASLRPSMARVSKGKELAAGYDQRPATMFQAGEPRRKAFKSDWMVDEVAAMAGADAWVERDRVILVLGRPTPDSLSPLLYNPQYAQTLLLIALSAPSPALSQLAAQTASERTTYPLIQLIDMPASGKTSPTQALTSTLQQASTISYQWRASLRAPPSSRMSWMGAGSRRSSTDSMASSLVPLTPPMSHRGSMSAPQIYSRRSSETSTASSQADNVAAGKRTSAIPSSRNSTSRPPVSNRKSSFFGMGKSGTTDPKLAPPASPFDAVIHIVPPAAECAPNRALQEMLQSTVLLTSAVVPMLAKRNMTSSSGKSPVVDSTPISLVHIVQPNSPHALPPVIENFVLSLVPKFQMMSERPISGYVVSQAAWLHPADRDMMSGGDLLLFGGARVRPTDMPDGSTRVKKRAYIPYWPHQGPPMTVAPNPDFTRPDYSTMVPLAPPANEKPVNNPPRRKSTTPRSPPVSSRPATKHHRSGLSQVILPSDLEDNNSLRTPDLDHAPSSASSQSHDITTPHASTYGSEMSSPTLTMDDLGPPAAQPVVTGGQGKVKKEGGFGSFVKRFGKKK